MAPTQTALRQRWMDFGVVLAVVTSAASLLGVAFAASAYPHRLDALERETIPALRSMDAQLVGEMRAFRELMQADRELMLRIDERMKGVDDRVRSMQQELIEQRRGGAR